MWNALGSKENSNLSRQRRNFKYAMKLLELGFFFSSESRDVYLGFKVFEKIMAWDSI